MMPIRSPSHCDSCVHIHELYRGQKRDKTNIIAVATCDAFPMGIPLEIHSRSKPHDTPGQYDDRGIQWEQDPNGPTPDDWQRFRDEFGGSLDSYVANADDLRLLQVEEDELGGPDVPGISFGGP